MEISRDLQTRAASKRNKVFTWDVEQHLESVEEGRVNPRRKVPLVLRSYLPRHGLVEHSTHNYNL